MPSPVTVTALTSGPTGSPSSPWTVAFTIPAGTIYSLFCVHFVWRRGTDVPPTSCSATFAGSALSQKVFENGDGVSPGGTNVPNFWVGGISNPVTGSSQNFVFTFNNYMYRGIIAVYNFPVIFADPFTTFVKSGPSSNSGITLTPTVNPNGIAISGVVHGQGATTPGASEVELYDLNGTLQIGAQGEYEDASGAVTMNPTWGLDWAAMWAVGVNPPTGGDSIPAIIGM